MKREILELLKETIEENFYLKEEIKNFQSQGLMINEMQCVISKLKANLEFEKQNK